MNQSKTCGEPCAVCDGCLEAHDAALRARVAELEADNGRLLAALTNRGACIGWLEDDIGQLKNNVDELDLENDTLRARVAVLEAKIAQAAKLIRPACQFEGEPWFTASELIAMARMVWAVLANEAVAGRKEG